MSAITKTAAAGHSTPDSRILTRAEAVSRLHHLIPGTEEHDQLQNALLKMTGIVEIQGPSTTYKVCTLDPLERLLGGFGSSEHVAIGKAVILKGFQNNPPLLVKGVVPIKFAYIIALAGDFYGVAGEAISLPGGDDQQKTARFIKALNTLLESDNNEIRRILLEVRGECTAVEHSSLPHHCYSSGMIEKNRAIKKIKGDIDDLLIDNSDHFSANAIDAYRIGHTLAISQAREAGKKNDLEGLKKAYATDAFACHFLTDLFASGHIRNQRGALEVLLISRLGFSAKKAKPLAGILTGAQHEKDGQEGLNVANKRGQHWRAYGDGCFFQHKNKENREMVVAATQQSVDEVYEAYQNPGVVKPSLMDQLIPFPTEFNPLPLYSVAEDGSTLVLFEGSQEIPIDSKSGYLTKGLSHALRYLPESYVSGFLKPFDFEVPPILAKVVLPQVERLTGVVWHMIGLASYHQVKQESQELNAKIDELADGMMGTYDNTLQILARLEEIQATLAQHSWSNVFQDVRQSVTSIKDVLHQHQTYKPHGLREEQKQEMGKVMWAAHTRLAAVFTSGTADDQKILVAYQTMLGKKEKKMDPTEIKITVTLWFRQMLEYQFKAFNLYAFYSAIKIIADRSEAEKKVLRKQVPIFNANLAAQIEANKDHIDESLIYAAEPYIVLQLQKSKAQRVAALEFNRSDSDSSSGEDS